MPYPPPEDLPHPKVELASPALAGRFFTTIATLGALIITLMSVKRPHHPKLEQESISLISPQSLTSNKRPPNLELSVSVTSPRRLLVLRVQSRVTHLPQGTTGLGTLTERKLQSPACHAPRWCFVFSSAPGVVVRACALARILLPEVLSRRPPRPPGPSRLTGISSPQRCLPLSASHHAARRVAPPSGFGPPRTPGPRLRRGRRCSGPCGGSGTDVLHLCLTHAGSDVRGARDPILDPSLMWPRIRAPNPQVGDSHSRPAPLLRVIQDANSQPSGRGPAFQTLALPPCGPGSEPPVLGSPALSPYFDMHPSSRGSQPEPLDPSAEFSVSSLEARWWCCNRICFREG